jgi:poly(3-hydroxybutyrate) depolymerase/lysophospholipase L1-like esterase
MSRVRLFFLGLFLSSGWLHAAAAAADADEAARALAREAYEARTLSSSGGASLAYRLLKPPGYDPARKYPLVLLLHGAGERGTDNAAQLKHGAAIFCAPGVREEYPAFVVVPQCPPDQKWVNIDWGSDKPVQPAEPNAVSQLVLELLASLQKEFSIDADRLYVTGPSMGGYGTWDMVTRHPEMWAAAVPVCGGGDPSTAARAKAVAVWAFHGTQDKVIKPARSQTMIAALEAAGARPWFSEYTYTGHEAWVIAYHEPMLLPWLFGQKRGQASQAFATLAGPHAQPPTNQCPGAGPMQPGIWFRNLWLSRRKAWDASKQADQGAVVFFGDSITQGWESLPQDFPNLKTANRGISGDTTRGLLTRVQGDVLDLHPRAVSLLIGTNDLDQGGDPQVALANVKALVAELHQADPQMPIILNKIMPRAMDPGRYPEKIQALNALYQDAFANDPRITFCDTFQLFDSGNGSVDKEIFPDFVHPNAEGYAMWKAALAPIFEKLKLGRGR